MARLRHGDRAGEHEIERVTEAAFFHHGLAGSKRLELAGSEDVLGLLGVQASQERVALQELGGGHGPIIPQGGATLPAMKLVVSAVVAVAAVVVPVTAHAQTVERQYVDEPTAG